MLMSMRLVNLSITAIFLTKYLRNEAGMLHQVTQIWGYLFGYRAFNLEGLSYL